MKHYSRKFIYKGGSLRIPKFCAAMCLKLGCLIQSFFSFRQDISQLALAAGPFFSPSDYLTKFQVLLYKVTFFG
jgi:hypothetical protein